MSHPGQWWAKMRINLVAFSLLAFLSVPVAAFADGGFRCSSGRLVSVDDRMPEVLERCGDPDFIGTRVAQRQIGDEYVEVFLDEWTYDLGPSCFVRFVIFENGQVIDVETGDWGKKQW